MYFDCHSFTLKTGARYDIGFYPVRYNRPVKTIEAHSHAVGVPRIAYWFSFSEFRIALFFNMVNIRFHKKLLIPRRYKNRYCCKQFIYLQ